MKSLVYRGTGRFIRNRQEAANLPAHQIVRNNEICEVQFLGDTRGLSMYKHGDVASGYDLRDTRLNAVGDPTQSATGFQVAMDTMTYRIRDIIQQKFFEVPPADFIPTIVGEGAWSENMLYQTEFSVSEDFEAGNLSDGANDARQSTADVAMGSLTQKVQDWAKTIGYSIPEVEKALRANNWDVIAAKHRARKKNWDLGIQKLAFLGSVNDTRFPGLLTNPAFPVTTGYITKKINTMTATELQTFLVGIIANFYSASNYTEMPDTFIVPASDFLGATIMVNGTNGTYPVPLIDYLQNAMSRAAASIGISGSRNPFKILPLAYAEAANNPAGLNYYMLYRRDAEVLRMNIPVPYTVTQANTLNGFMFHDSAYAQYTGVMALRPSAVQIFTY